MSTQVQDTGSVVLAWNRASCEEGISHYRIYLNGTVVANVRGSNASYVINNMPFETNLTFYVLAVTNRCRVSKKSNEASIVLTNTNKKIALNYSLDFFI